MGIRKWTFLFEKMSDANQFSLRRKEYCERDWSFSLLVRNFFKGRVLFRKRVLRYDVNIDDKIRKVFFSRKNASLCDKKSIVTNVIDDLYIKLCLWWSILTYGIILVAMFLSYKCHYQACRDDGDEASGRKKRSISVLFSYIHTYTLSLM